MNRPTLDPRSPEELRAKIRALAKSYTPEWRYERTEDDAGAAIAELFAEMYCQTVDRLNALPEKLYVEFLNQIGFQEPGPMSAGGTMLFEPHDNATEPASVPAGTQIFTPDEEGENIVFETERSIQITPARLKDIYYVDGRADSFRRLDLSAKPQRFFEPVGEELQSHRLLLCENDVLRLDAPARIELSLHREVRHMEEDTAKLLTDGNLEWSFRHDGVDIPFDSVRAERGRLILEKKDSLALEPDEEGHICICCAGHPSGELILDAVELSSAPLAPCKAQSVYSDDLPIDFEEGGYCFGRRPAPYDFFYLRSDAALTKRGAEAMLHLDIVPVIDEPEAQTAQYNFTQSIIDKRSAIERKPDDVAVTQVLWEYYNGLGWRNLTVRGDKNPFSCKREGSLDVRFTVPDDIVETEVNAETGYYIRARVVEISNPYSFYQRWILPFVKNATFVWSYDHGINPTWLFSENNGRRYSLPDANLIAHLSFPALSVMQDEAASMYFRFDASPHAMPLSLRFQVEGRSRLSGQLLWEFWNGKAFEPARAVDRTDCLLHSGEMFLFLSDPLPEAELFGVSGCWLRLCRSEDKKGTMPAVAAVLPNTVSALQKQREPEQLFDTGIYEAGKRVFLLSTPVQESEVWVDEASAISTAELAELTQSRGSDGLRVEKEEHILTHCWVRWDRVSDLALAGPNDRVYSLMPYQGEIRFGDGRQGRVPPTGDHNIRVRYSSGGGPRGNVPAGTVNSLLTSMPQVSSVRNLTPMSGGTGRLHMGQIEERGSRYLRNRGRAAGRRDYEEIVLERFPQVSHVRCFPGRDERGARAPGQVTVVITGFGGGEEETERLCRKVYELLKTRSPCCLTEEKHLHVCPATVLHVNTSVTVETEHPELAAETQQEIVRRLEELIGKTWKSRPIGEQIHLNEVWSVVRDTKNVALIKRILVEASYDFEGRSLLAPLSADSDFPYGVVESGRHLVRLS